MGSIIAARAGLAGDPGTYTFRTVDPAAITGVGQLYWKNVAPGENELFVRDEDSGIDIVQITDGNALNAGAIDHNSTLNLAVGDVHTQYAPIVGRPGEDLTVQGKVIVATIGPTGARQHTLPDIASDTVALLAAAQTLTTKSVDLASNTVTGTAAEFDAACSDDSFAYVSDNLSVFAATTSAQLAGVISDETGSSLLVFNTSPTLVTPDVNGGTVDSLTALSIRSTGAAYDLTLATATAFTAGRTLTIDPGDAARTLTLSGNPTLDDWFDQDVKAASSPTFVNLSLTSFATDWTNAGRTIADLGVVTTVDVNGGTIDGVTIGGASAGAITATTITAGGVVQLSGNDLIGSTGAAGTCTIVATSHGTPGAVICEVEPGVEAWRTLATGEFVLGVNALTSATDVAEFKKDQQAGSYIRSVNDTDHASASAGFSAVSSSGNTILLGHSADLFSSNIGVNSNEGFLYLGTGGDSMALVTDGPEPIRVVIDSAEVARFVVGGLLIGPTALTVATDIAECKKSVNTTVNFRLEQGTNDTTAAAAFEVIASSNEFQFGHTAAAFTPNAGINADEGFIVLGAGGASMGLVTRGAHPIRFATNGTADGVNSERARILPAGGIVNGLGEGGTTLAVGYIFRAPDLSGGTDIAGADCTIGAGEGRGDGDVGQIIFQTPRVQASGATAQTRATLMTLDEDVVTIAGDLIFDGEGSGLLFGEIYVKDNAGATTLNSAAKVQITNFAVDGASNGMTPDHTNDHITVDTAGKYLCTVNLHVNNNAAQTHVIDISVWKNNGAAEFLNVHAHETLTGGSGDVKSMPASGIIDLAANDTIEVWADTSDAADRSVTFEDITLSLVKLGGT